MLNAVQGGVRREGSGGGDGVGLGWGKVGDEGHQVAYRERRILERAPEAFSPGVDS